MIPGKVFFTIDLRHPEDAVLSEDGGGGEGGVPRRLRPRSASLELDFEEIWYSPPVKFDANCVAAVKAGAEELGYASHADHQRRRPRRLLHEPGGADRHDLHPVRGRHQPQRDRERDPATICGAGCDVLLRAMVERANAS